MMETLESLPHPDLAPAMYAKAAATLAAGELVALPTETVYGLGADASNPAAVAKIFAAKGRPADHPLIVHLPADQWLERWACDIPAVAWELAEMFWPGPLTLILPKQAWVPKAVTGGQNTVGLRVPGHPVALGLLHAFAEVNANAGIAAPSANRFGRISPTTAAHVAEELGDKVPLILDGGACQVGIESTILDLSYGAGENSTNGGKPTILRPGHITPEQLAVVLGDVPDIMTAHGAPRVSGSLAAHYAPSTPLRVVMAANLLDYLNAIRHRGGRCGVLSHSQLPQAGMPHIFRQLSAHPIAYAHDFYAALRDLDHEGLDTIVVEALPTLPANSPLASEWAAVADRLRRAVAGSGQ